MALGRVLERSLADVAVAGLEQLLHAHGRHAAAREGVLRRLADWPAPARGLLNDHGYDFPPPPARPERPLPPALERGVAGHIEREWQRWRNTNLSKYLELAPAGGGP